MEDEEEDDASEEENEGQLSNKISIASTTGKTKSSSSEEKLPRYVLCMIFFEVLQLFTIESVLQPTIDTAAQERALSWGWVAQAEIHPISFKKGREKS